MIQALSDIVNQVLTFFYGLVNNYGLAIIMLTISVNIITYPLTRKQLQSSKKLQEIQPELNRIKQKFKNDKEQLNKATMEFMSKNKVNPLGGCLPLLVQFPILIAVFQLLRNQEMIRSSIEAMNMVFSPYFINWNLTLPDPYYILPIMAAGTTFFQQRMMLTDPNQKMLMYIFPVMILFISVSLPAGLILYWFTNSLISIGNYTLMKRESNPFTELASKFKQDKEQDKEQDRAQDEDTKITEDKPAAEINKSKNKNRNKKEEAVAEVKKEVLEVEIEEPEEEYYIETNKKNRNKDNIERFDRNRALTDQQKSKIKKASDKGPKKKNIKAKKKGADKE